MGGTILKMIDCRGSSRAMGQQYGEGAREEIRRDLELRRVWNPPDLNSFAVRIEQILQKFLPDALEEIRGIAEGAGVDLRQVLFANHVDVFGNGEERCTPVLLRNSPEGTIVAKNNDAPGEEDYPFIIRRCSPDHGLPFVQVTYAGWLSGFDGMNAEGLANTHGSVGSVFDKNGPRLDIRLKMCQLMRNCRTTAELLAGLNEIPLTGKGFNIAIGDACGHTAMLDAAVPFIAVRSLDKTFEYATNIYRAPGLENADRRDSKKDICTYRYGYLKWREATNPPHTLDDMKSLLSSHDPWAPCRHGGIQGSETTWSMICLTAARKVLIAPGHPCRHDYQEYGF